MLIESLGRSCRNVEAILVKLASTGVEIVASELDIANAPSKLSTIRITCAVLEFGT